MINKSITLSDSDKNEMTLWFIEYSADYTIRLLKKNMMSEYMELLIKVQASPSPEAFFNQLREDSIFAEGERMLFSSTEITELHKKYPEYFEYHNLLLFPAFRASLLEEEPDWNKVFSQAYTLLKSHYVVSIQYSSLIRKKTRSSESVKDYLSLILGKPNEIEKKEYGKLLGEKFGIERARQFWKILFEDIIVQTKEN